MKKIQRFLEERGYEVDYNISQSKTGVPIYSIEVENRFGVILRHRCVDPNGIMKWVDEQFGVAPKKKPASKVIVTLFKKITLE